MVFIPFYCIFQLSLPFTLAWCFCAPTGPFFALFCFYSQHLHTYISAVLVCMPLQRSNNVDGALLARSAPKYYFYFYFVIRECFTDSLPHAAIVISRSLSDAHR